ncbi:TraB/GumN family protein [Hymenobacter lapidiphilus]|uniref:TraB/GumN family protein n=1 Tax=Hymenobacter lapidiphilus TaxID=2608003 RepID=A0A7Y7PQQ3_9BACT|nr:TraB/GumN family protein [Hymenobacter lapidiphilus]NVO32104.1 TraB/GumN family protein [Hymenobacter lapidiphilus]
MRLFSLSFAATLLLASPLAQAQKVAKAPKTATAPATTKSLLWEISGNKLAKPSYVFGTIHLLCADDLKMSEAVKKAIDNSQQIALEVDMDSPTMMEEMRGQMMLPAGQTVQGCMTKEEYAAVSEYYTNELKMPFAQMGTMKPFILSSLMYPKTLGCPVGSYEGTLVDIAKAKQLEVIGLETVADQMGIFDKIPCDKQARMLSDMVAKRSEAQQEFKALFQLYQAQDVEGLLKASLASQFGMKEYEDELITNRNKRWIPLMAQQASNKPTFFAVGAAHLGGSNGVLTLLRQQGYQVKPVL